jgi:hypothetical protein
MILGQERRSGWSFLLSMFCFSPGCLSTSEDVQQRLENMYEYANLRIVLGWTMNTDMISENQTSGIILSQ